MDPLPYFQQQGNQIQGRIFSTFGGGQEGHLEKDSKSQHGGDVNKQGTQEAQSPRTVVEEAPNVENVNFQKLSSSHTRVDAEKGIGVQEEHDEDAYLQATLEARLQKAIRTMDVKMPPLGTVENEAYWKEVLARASSMSSKASL